MRIQYLMLIVKRHDFPYGFLMFSSGRERVRWEQTGLRNLLYFVRNGFKMFHICYIQTKIHNSLHHGKFFFSLLVSLQSLSSSKLRKHNSALHNYFSSLSMNCVRQGNLCSFWRKVLSFLIWVCGSTAKPINCDMFTQPQVAFFLQTT